MPITHITPDELKQMLRDTPTLQLIDVRTPEEFAYLGHIRQAQLIPLSELPYAFRALDPTAAVVVTCQHGIRSLDACYFLQAQGFDTLFNLQDGMSVWTDPLEREIFPSQAFMPPSTQGDP